MKKSFLNISRFLLALCLIAGASAPAAGQGVEAGPYEVGFRVLETYDHSRAIGPKRDHTGALHPDRAAMPLPVYLWYPAQPGTGEPMRYGTYLFLTQAHKRGSYGPITDADREAAGNLPRGIAQHAWNESLTDEQLQVLFEQPTAARRDAAPADGVFPLLLSGLYGAQSGNKLAEHLASHGYIVATGPMRPEVLRQQVTEPQVAMETQSRNLEYVLAQVHDLPFVDARKMGLLAINFDGLAALNVQMRNMQADAVASLDGWEGKPYGSSTLQASPYFDALKMRVPYLFFSMHAPDEPQYQPDEAFFDTLRYADRFFYVLRDVPHYYYIGDLLAWPHRRAEVEPAYAFVYATVRDFFDAHVKEDSGARARLEAGASTEGVVLDYERRAPALPPAPTQEEFASLLEHDLAEAARVLQAARADNPDVELASLRTLNLMAFRARQREAWDEAVAVNRIKTMAFPASAQAHLDLGSALQQTGQVEEAVAAYRKALAVLPADPDVTEAERDEMRGQIQARLEEMRPR